MSWQVSSVVAIDDDMHLTLRDSYLVKSVIWTYEPSPRHNFNILTHDSSSVR
jgi:hypothetical protein